MDNPFGALHKIKDWIAVVNIVSFLKIKMLSKIVIFTVFSHT